MGLHSHISCQSRINRNIYKKILKSNKMKKRLKRLKRKKIRKRRLTINFDKNDNYS